ncbi:hypothetical protein vBBak6_027 [Bacillus phage v_B-Bak6]|uniref:Uncharacterized protein n=1 Tax=Bacillus phage v_B-Bak10 TaxID=2094736 RepID=A0A385IK09_9CAUD|nr:hypothetical protein PP654_gp110 [Bacillus phage v_B-Bak10]AXY82987.1 hypothetical protein vBBak1_027 [Bacillus phage v_B-Bak1]AXY83107.1 hypothetical protein vBBak6_027 [Bacillus phage v_B-Bak6]AXY83248.1 hypothetical protein vBBBak10_0032 [Bacillus phage v_B-Bak10]
MIMALKHFTNPVSFYYRKDLTVTKHGEYKAKVEMDFGTPAKIDPKTGLIEPAATSDEFEGIVDKIVLEWQESDKGRLKVKAGERCRIGIGTDYEFVVKGLASVDAALVVGDAVEVKAGKFIKLATGTAVGKVTQKFANGEIAIAVRK